MDNRAIIDRTNIYKYWLQRNQSDIYPEKLDQLFEKSAELIANFPPLEEERIIETCTPKLCPITF